MPSPRRFLPTLLALAWASLAACSTGSKATIASEGGAGSGGGAHPQTGAAGASAGAGASGGVPAMAGSGGADAIGGSGVGNMAGGGGGPVDAAVDVGSADAGGPAEVGAGPPLRALSVAVGDSHSCALLEDHTVKCWGVNGSGQLGYGDTRARGLSRAEMGDALPTVDLGSGRTATAIGASQWYSCAILDDGSVKCWGFGNRLGLPGGMARGMGSGEMGDALPALDLGAGRRAKQLAVGWDWACALLDDETVACWGDKVPGAAPDAGAGPLMLPTTIPLGTSKGVATLAAGGHGVWALLVDGTLLGMLPGSLLGQPWSTSRGRITSFAGARELMCAIFGGATACVIGFGGPPDTVNDLATIGVGEIGYSCGIAASGAVRCWGGPGSIRATFWTDGVAAKDRSVTVQIVGEATALASGGQQHMCALTADGRVWCWGAAGPMVGASSDPTTAPGVELTTWGPVDLGTRH
jgi:hypothetical protein